MQNDKSYNYKKEWLFFKSPKRLEKMEDNREIHFQGVTKG